MTQHRRLAPLIDRRSLLGGLIGASSAVSAPALFRSLPARAQFSSFPFSLGVASGDPSADGFVIWTRIAPQPLAADGGLGGKAVDVRWDVAADSGMQRILQSGRAEATAAFGHSVHVEIAGLEPGQDYFYRFRTGEAESMVGRSRTLPGAGSTPSQLRFASAGCQRWEAGYFTAWRRIAEEAFDFVVHYGDYIYEAAAINADDKGGALARTMPSEFGPCLTLADYRRRYALYKSDSDLQAAHASCAFLPSFDDHEVVNNWTADVDPKKKPLTAFLPRRTAAFQAWYEHMPVRLHALPRGPDVLAYRAFRFGNLANMAVLDTRQYRSHRACAQLFDSCKQADAPDRTMLGVAQERWLADILRAGAGTWQILAQQVLFSRLDWRSFPGHRGSQLQFRMDAWDGASAGRRRVLEILRETRAANPVVLTGDAHKAMAFEVKEADDPNSPAKAVEFLATSISSGGDGNRSVKNADAIFGQNPQLKFLGNERGYTRHVVTAKRWQADYRAVPKVTKRDEAVVTRKSFVVEAGRPGLMEA